MVLEVSLVKKVGRYTCESALRRRSHSRFVGKADGGIMSVSLLTALEIGSNDDDTIRCEAGFDKEAQKWVGWIMYYRDGAFHKPMLNSAPIFQTEEEAVESVRRIVKDIRIRMEDKNGHEVNLDSQR